MAGLWIYAAGLVALGLLLPAQSWNATSPEFLLIVGSVAAWRYIWAGVHLGRALIYKNIVFPRMRKKATALGEAGLPSHVYLLVTSFRIDTETSVNVFRGCIEEAIRCGARTTIVASIVEMADQRLIKQMFNALSAPDHIDLMFVRIPGTGKRDGLASSFRAISAARPPQDAVVYVIDGDSVMPVGSLAKTLPFFKLYPKMDALTTDETCQYDGDRVYRDWYNMRFAQRQVQMCSMALSRRVLTLTGRMSAFRASAACDPEFIALVQNDSFEHWRLGKIKFLTGDDKSSWYYILKSGAEMIYVPDVRVVTIEYPPSDNFFVGATILMRRWFGNMLRNGSRAIALGPRPMGFFVWWCLLDQRMAMWTSLIGPVGAIALSLAVSPFALAIYAYWVLLTRFAQCLLLLNVRREVSWTYPFLLFFNQVYGSLVKTYILFRLDKQSWTRQKTAAVSNVGAFDGAVLRATSTAMHAFSISIFVLVVAFYVGAMRGSDFFSPYVFSAP